MVVAPLVVRSALALSFADYISPSTRPINALERFTIVVALKHWALLLQGHKFIIACDNSAASAVAVINSTTSKVARTLSFSVASDNFGSPLLFSILKRAHRMFRANTINLRIVWVAGTQMLQLVTVFIVYVVTLIIFFHFHDVDSACFSFDVAWLHLPFLFCFFFVDPSAGSARPPLPVDVSVVPLQFFVSRLITLAHATSTQKNSRSYSQLSDFLWTEDSSVLCY